MDAADAGERQFEGERNAEDLQDALMGLPAETPSSQYDQLDKTLPDREAVARALQGAYRGFDSLAQYDAAGDFAASATSLLAAVQSAGGKGADDPAEQIGANLGGELLAVGQVRRLKRASHVLSTALTLYSRYLDTSSAASISVEQHAVRAHYDAVDALWKAGLLTSADLLASLQPEAGFALADPPGTYTVKNARAAALVTFALRQRKNSALDAAVRGDAERRALIQALISKHHTFEAGGDFTLQDLAAAADRLAVLTATTSGAKP